MNQAQLTLLFQLKDEVSQGVEKINASLGNLNNNPVVSGAMAGAFTALTGAALSAGSAVIGGIGDSIGVAADFASQMQRVGAVSGASASEIEMMRDAAIEMGSATVFSSSEAAAAMFELAAGGMNAQQSVAALPGTLALAAAGGVELASAAEITAATLNGFQMSADQAGSVADKFSVIANISAAGVLDLGESMKYIAPVAAAMGMSIDDTGAALAVLANNGIKGSQAGTALRAIMLGLASPSAEAAKAIESLGIQVFDAEGHMKGMPEIIAEFNNATANLTDQQKAAALATIVGREASGSMLALMAAGEGTIQGYSDQLANSAGAAEEMATNSQTAFDLMKGNIGGAIEQVQIALGDLLIPILVMAGNALAGLAPYALQFIASLQGFMPVIQQVIDLLVANWQPALAIVAGILGGLLIGAIGMAVSALAGMVVAFAPVIAAVMAAIAIGAALAGAWNSNFMNIQGLTASAMAAIQSVITAVLGVILTFWQNNGTEIMAFAQTTWTQVQAIIGGIVAIILTIVTGIFNTIAGFINDHGAEIQLVLETAWKSVENIITLAMGVIQGIVNTVLGVITGDWEKAGQGINQIVDSIKTYVVDQFNNLKNLVMGLGPGFLTAAQNIGQAIIDGIVGGISAGASAIAEAAKGAAQAALDAAKGLLGIKSPSRVFESVVGGNIVAGLVQGLESGVGAVQSAASTLAGATAAPFTATPLATAAPLGAPARGGETSNTVNLTINVNGGADRSTIAAIETAARKAVQNALAAAGQNARARAVTG